MDTPRSRAWAASRSRVWTGTLIVVVRVDMYVAYVCRQSLATIRRCWRHNPRNRTPRTLIDSLAADPRGGGAENFHVLTTVGRR